MALCLACGLIETHERGCVQAPLPPTTPAEKAERVRRAMDRAEAARAAAAQPADAKERRRAVLSLLGASALLEEFSARDLTAFDEKRRHNDLVTKITKEREELLKGFPEETARTFTDDALFVKKSLELLFAYTCAKIAAAELDPAPLTKLLTPIAAASATPVNIAALSSEVEARVAETTPLDAEVKSWKWVNLRPLMTGREPKEIPPDRVAQGGVSGVLGALVGRGATTRRLGAIGQFKLLGDKFRERLYLIAANGLLLRVRSRLAKAEDAWKRHLAAGDPNRWEALRTTSRDVIEHYLGVPAPNGLDPALKELAAKAPKLNVVQLRPFEELDPDDWDAFAKAYFFELTALMNDLSSRDIALSAVAPALVERKKGVPVDTAGLASLLKAVRETWHSRPPSDD